MHPRHAQDPGGTRVSAQRPDGHDGFETAGWAALAGALAPHPVEKGRREALRERILRRVSRERAPLPGTTTWRSADDDWFDPAPFVRMKVLRIDSQAGTQELLIRLEPGVRVPEHSHSKEEHMVILDGELHVGEHLLRAGDVHVAAPGTRHPPITTRSGALVLLRCEHPLPA